MADGPSDLPLAAHIETLCRRAGLPMDIVALDPRRLPGMGPTVARRLTAALVQDSDFDCVFVHRDAEGQDPELRHAEVSTGVKAGGFSGPAVAVVPIRMTEAWLLLDERLIRQVAGHPTGRAHLGLPPQSRVEDIADPKAVLQSALMAASEARGRRRKTMRSRFGAHRHQLLERLDPDGPVQLLSAWKRLGKDISDLADSLAQ